MSLAQQAKNEMKGQGKKKIPLPNNIPTPCQQDTSHLPPTSRFISNAGNLCVDGFAL